MSNRMPVLEFVFKSVRIENKISTKIGCVSKKFSVLTSMLNMHGKRERENERQYEGGQRKMGTLRTTPFPHRQKRDVQKFTTYYYYCCCRCCWRCAAALFLSVKGEF